MATILNEIKDTRMKWKKFIFPLSIKNFSLKESAKIATYEYAGRNGAEHERVLGYRIFTLSGEFIPGVNKNKTPAQLIYDLRLTNDNKPGVFYHPDIGSFNCIMNNLTIDQDGESYSTISPEITNLDNSKYIIDASGKAKLSSEGLYSSYSFSIELFEHTPPNAKTLSDQNNQLFPKSTVKPISDSYTTSLLYHNSDELFNAIIEGKILPGVNPIINAEWLRYDFDMRATAYKQWEAIGFTVGVKNTNVTNTNTNQRSYTIKAGDTGTKIAKKFNVAFTDLFQVNHGKKVRKNPNGTEGLYWKTARLLYAGDTIIIPN